MNRMLLSRTYREENSGDGNGDGDGGSDSGIAQRPEYMPENFWNGETGEPNVEGLAKSYSEMRTKMDGKNESLRGELETELRGSIEKEAALKYRPEGDYPDSVEGYVYEVPENGLEGMPEGMTFEVDSEDPMMKHWQETAFSNGLSKETFNAGVEAYTMMLVGNLPSMDTIIEELGESGAARVEATDNWMAENLSKESYEVMANMGNMHGSAKFVRVIEELAHLAKGTPLQAFDEAGDGKVIGGAPIGDADIKEMMSDPKYWREKDPDFIAKVQDLLGKRYNKK